MLDVAAQAEAAKYDHAFRQPNYRIKCHGLEIWRRQRSIFPEAVTSGIDLGCGTGRLVQRWVDEGIDGYGVDLVPEVAVDQEIYAAAPERFTKASLWDFAPGRRFDVGVCADVMEHIPREYVPAVLERIRECCGMCVFQIANFKSAIDGHALHLTIENDDWWRTQLTAVLGPVIQVARTDRPSGERYLFRWTT